jgi:DNA-binding transcriptional MocR family regulator
MLYVPGQYCFPNEGEPIQDNTMRLSFGVQTMARIRQGMQALAKAIHQAQAAND